MTASTEMPADYLPYVFLVLLPGFIARSRIKRVERLSLDYSPFGQVVTEAILWAGSLHFFWVWLSEFGPKEFKPEVALKPLGADPNAQAKALEAVALNASWITAYFGSLLLVPHLAPTIVRSSTTHYKFDRSDFTSRSTSSRSIQEPDV